MARLCVSVALLALGTGHPLVAQDAAKANQKMPLATSITVTSPVDDATHGRVRSAALELQHRAEQENRKAFLVLEITPGSSQFHQVQGLARFLSSSAISNVTTIAWIPQTVTGNNAILALACHEIVMHPDAELGDIGRGEALDAVDQQFVLSIVDKRHNVKVNRALAKAMMDPQVAIWKIQVQVGPPDKPTQETRIVTEAELRTLQENMAIIPESRSIKEAGAAGLFSGEAARKLDILVKHTAASRAKIPELYNLPRESMRENPTTGAPPNVRLIKIEGTIDPILEAFIDRQIDRAARGGANMIIFEIDSPGGYLLSSTNLADTISSLEAKNIRTVAYIPQQALSGAAIIALGCDDIYMHPNAQIGDAGPIEIGEGGQFERAPEKVLSSLRKTLKALADKKSRPSALAEAMADKDLPVFQVTHRETGRVWYMTEDEIHSSNGEWIKGPIVPESREENLLTLDGQRAGELKMAQPAVQDRDQLKQRLGIPAETELAAVERTWVDTLVFVLNSSFVTFLLFVVGAACIYLELYTMTGFFGIVSALCFSLFFWSRFLGGTAGWLEVILFVLGVALILLEIFVIPGFGVFGISGGLLLIGAIVMASQTFSSLEPGQAIDDMAGTIVTLGGALLTVIVLAVVMSRYLPQMPLLKHIILAPPGAEDTDEPRLRPEYAATEQSTRLYAQDLSIVGMQGVAISVLRPAGKAQIDGRYLDVVSDGAYIQRGSRVEVVSISGNRIIVRQV